MKKTAFIFALALMLASNTAFAQFSDIESDSLTFMYRHGIIDGYPDGTFGPEKPINRAELIKIIMSAENLNPDSVAENCFPDLTAGEWYVPNVCTAKERGWVSGYSDGTFKPGNYINKAEAFKIINNILALDQYGYFQNTLTARHQFKDVPGESWYFKYADNIEELLYVDWTDYLYPADEITREEVAEILFRNLLTEKLYQPRKAESLSEAASETPGVEAIAPAESLALAARDFFRIADVIENTNYQEALDYQEEWVTPLYEDMKSLVNAGYDFDPEVWNLNSVVEKDGYIYAVLAVEDPLRELQTWWRDHYDTYAVIKFNGWNLQIEAYDFFTLNVDHVIPITAIAEIKNENNVDIYIVSTESGPGTDLNETKKSFHLRDLRDIPLQPGDYSTELRAGLTLNLTIDAVDDTPGFTLPDFVDPEQLSYSSKYFKIGDLYFAIANRNTMNMPVGSVSDFAGIFAAKDGEESWNLFTEVKDTPDEYGHGNNPLWFWNEGSMLYMTVYDIHGAGSGEGYMKLLSSDNYGQSWTIDRCFYFGSDFDCQSGTPEDLQSAECLESEYPYNPATGEFEMTQMNEFGINETLPVPECKNVQI